ncbi:MAG: membrane protein insertion efficiency factor YidD [Acidobacteriaceae bacterium]|nr:membrane protein insertion efficiency factor YidD [Acidobacteriaceae bacterium]
MQRLLIAALKGYKFFVSPLLPSACRFYPTCSEYMMEAIAKHGAAQGAWMGLKRLGRCHPFHAGGYDPVNEHDFGK